MLACWSDYLDLQSAKKHVAYLTIVGTWTTVLGTQVQVRLKCTLVLSQGCADQMCEYDLPSRAMIIKVGQGILYRDYTMVPAKVLVCAPSFCTCLSQTQ